MNKLLILLVVLFSLSFAGNHNDMDDYPVDVDSVMLFDASAASGDTFTAAETQGYGPYELTSNSGLPMCKGFQVFALPITGTTPTMEMSYQLLPQFGTTLDTNSLWTVIDTLDGTGVSTYVDLSSKAGKSIAFKINNYDGTECQIPDYLIINFKESLTYNKEK